MAARTKKSNTAPNPYPVDSATRTCCGGIGDHTQECAQGQPIDLDPPDPALVRWRQLTERDGVIKHDYDISNIVPAPRPEWSDIERDEINSSIFNCRYGSTPVRVDSKFHELGLEGDGKWRPAAAYVMVVMTGTGSKRVRVNWSRQAPSGKGWVNEPPFSFTPAEALELAGVLRAAVDLLGGAE